MATIPPESGLAPWRRSGRAAPSALQGDWGMPGRTSILAVLLTATSVLAFAPAAEAAGWLEKNFWLFRPRYSGKLAPCDHTVALSKIKYLFGLKDQRLRKPDFAIGGF